MLAGQGTMIHTPFTRYYTLPRAFPLYTALRTRLPGCSPSASLTSCIGGFCPSSTLEDRSGVASCASESAIRFAKNGERRKRCTCRLVSFLWLAHARDQPRSRLSSLSPVQTPCKAASTLTSNADIHITLRSAIRAPTGDNHSREHDHDPPCLGALHTLAVPPIVPQTVLVVCAPADEHLVVVAAVAVLDISTSLQFSRWPDHRRASVIASTPRLTI